MRELSEQAERSILVLREWARRYDLTQREIAERLGVSERSIRYWFAGAKPSPIYEKAILEGIRKVDDYIRLVKHERQPGLRTGRPEAEGGEEILGDNQFDDQVQSHSAEIQQQISDLEKRLLELKNLIEKYSTPRAGEIHSRKE